MVSHPDSSVVGPQIVICARIVLGRGILNIGRGGAIKSHGTGPHKLKCLLEKVSFPDVMRGGGCTAMFREQFYTLSKCKICKSLTLFFDCKVGFKLCLKTMIL